MDAYKKIKTALVGCGMISNIYIKNLKELFSVIDLVALCDMNSDAAQEKGAQYGIDRIMTIEDVYRSEDIELIVNLTGPSAHYEVIKGALMAGKNVFTEKLLCSDLEQGKELVRLADEKGLYLGVAPDTFLGAGLQTARRILDSCLIG